MKFHEKLQELRKKKGLTQEELATALYVSRTAVSKWETGKGYPEIDTLKAIASFFAITVDDLLSGEELICAAKAENRHKERHVCDLVCGLLDVCILLLLFLPCFTAKNGEAVQALSLFALDGIRIYLKALYLIAVLATGAMGIAMLALQNCESAFWLKAKHPLSLGCNAFATLLFILARQPYAGAFTLALLTVKVFMLLKNR